MTNELKSKSKDKIYITVNGSSDFGLQGITICENGHILAGHICSSESFLSHDFGITSNWKHKSYDKHCGKDNWELILDPTGDNIPKEVFERKKEIPLHD